MIRLFSRSLLAVFAFLSISCFSFAQSDAAGSDNPVTGKKVSKPYKILTSGKKITIQSKDDIKNLMVWTSEGHRIVEQHDLNVTSYSFSISINEKYFFLMVEMKDGKRYSEKLGLQ